MLRKKSAAGFLFVIAFVFFVTGIAYLTAAWAENEPGSQSPENTITLVPRSMTYQGILKNNTGEPLADSCVMATCRVFDQFSGGSSLWSQDVQICSDESGYFSIVLTAIYLPFSADYYLEIQVTGEPAMSPRQKLNMSPYAARADSCQYSVAGGGWIDFGPLIRLGDSNDDVGIGATEPAAKLDVGDVARIQGLHYPDFPTTGAGLELAYRPSDNTGMVQAFNRNTSEWGDIYLGSGNVGIATSNPTSKLHVVGDVKVTGVMYTPFPRPAYDSGWFTLDSGEETTLVHSLGGNVDDYFVDIQMRKADNTISNENYGGEWYTMASIPVHWGARYEGLSSSQVIVHKNAEEGNYTSFRVRIWVVE